MFHHCVRDGVVQVKNVRSAVHARQPNTSVTSTGGCKLAKAHVRCETWTIVEPLASALQRVAVELSRTDARLEELARGEPVIERLTTAPGVGLAVAAVPRRANARGASTASKRIGR